MLSSTAVHVTLTVRLTLRPEPSTTHGDHRDTPVLPRSPDQFQSQYITRKCLAIPTDMLESA
jgi:hypothetical protein